MNPLCVSAIAPTVLPIASRPTTMSATISSPVLLRIALSFLIETYSSLCQLFHPVLIDTSYTVHHPADDTAASMTLRDRDLLQSGSRVHVFGPADLSFGVALPKYRKCLVVPRPHPPRRQFKTDPAHQEH